MPFALPIERRFPYLDRRLVEFCLSLPPEKKYEHLRNIRKGNVRGRVLQRHGLKGILPEEIRQSQFKVNYNEVYHRRFRQFKDAYIHMFAFPSIPLAAKLDYLDHKRFWEALSDALRHSEQLQEVAPTQCFWINRITQLEIWLQVIMSRKQRLNYRYHSTSWSYEKLIDEGKTVVRIQK
jgi:asparagine synthase (glutamine-hydrolysing)